MLKSRTQSSKSHSHSVSVVNRKQRRAAARLKQASTRQFSPETEARAVTSGVAQLLATGRKLHEAGRLAEAEAYYHQVLVAQPDDAETLNLLGLAAFQAGQMDVAINAFRGAIKSDGRNPGYLCNLGNVFCGGGKFEEAVAAYRQAISINPHFADAYSNLGAALERQGKLGEAAAAYRHAIAIKPTLAEAYGNLGIVLNRQGKFREAVAAYRQAISIRPCNANFYFNLGIALKEHGSLDDVVIAYRQAISIKPDYADAHFNLGLALKEQGKLEESRLALENAVRLSPTSPGKYRVLTDAKRFRPGDPHLAMMEQLAQRMSSFSHEEQIELNFALAKAYEDLEDYDRSFQHLLEGNALKRRSIRYDQAATMDQLNRTKDVFTIELMDALRDVGDPSTAPIFIVGMPRSGTTLVEQILASHPKVFGAGELNHVINAVAKLALRNEGTTAGFPEVVTSMRGEAFSQFGATYVSAIRALAPNAERVTDKMPLNFAYAGLIHLALPNARIIHVRRDPLDTCFSCFSKLFAEDQPYSYHLGELGRFYRSYQSLMEHWRAILPPGVMLDVDYEEVTANLDMQARRIIRHCGLDWNDACLRYYQINRPVRTASAVQVRQPIYSSSIGRWRPYQHWLRPLMEGLTLVTRD